MKKITYFIALILCISCEDVIDVEVPEGEPKLVIDASLEFFKTEIPLTVEGGVRLSLSSPFFENDVNPVNNATVFITNLSNGTVINFFESQDSGFYFPIRIDQISEFDTDYELTVIYNEETYKATTRVIPTVPIDSIRQGDRVLFGDDEKEVIVSFTDDGNRDDFYLFDFDFNLFLPSEDRFYQGENFTFSYFYEDLDLILGKEVTIKILGIDQRYFNYFNIILEQAEQNGGNPFQTPPAQIRGNFVNITNPENNALGYFNLSEANRFLIVIEE